jgi:putative nucleotidyltransferase with HDIG domain
MSLSAFDQALLRSENLEPIPADAKMLVHFITDEPVKIPVIQAMLEPHYDVESQVLGSGDTQIGSNAVLMVDADLSKWIRVEQVRAILLDAPPVAEKLFVVQHHLHHMAAQAFALGATAVVSRPNEIISKLAQIAVLASAARADCSDAPLKTANSAAAFASMFSDTRRGRPLALSDAENATSEIISGVAQRGVGAWLDSVRRHHEGTFQHCLLVTGVAVGFALDLGFGDVDVRRLGLAATLHDIGKANIPLSILDKPGRLDPGEEQIMRRHPVIGYELLKAIPEISPEVLDGTRHHHEYLDGSGYPDALAGSEISDLVRLLTISDIFAALIESRSYRPPMSRRDAYEVLCTMDGKLERSLVRAFRNVALKA